MGYRHLVPAVLFGLSLGSFACGQATTPGNAGARPNTRPSTGSVSPQATAPRNTPPSQQRLSQQQGLKIAQARPIGPSKEFQLTADQQKRLDMILNYWEKKTDEIKTFQCKFTRENWDFVFGPKGAPRSVDQGTVRYAKPDKGLMRVDTVWEYDAESENKKNPFKKVEVQFGEYWVCDGQAIFQFDSRTKTLTETTLPPEMQGQAIAEGPLPFLFGAKAETMKERYWIRELRPPTEIKDKYWLEAVPKHAADAANFVKLQVILAKPESSGELLLPENIKVFNKQGYVMYRFSEHAPNNPTHRVAGFFKSFVRPKTPRGWTKVVENWNDPAMAVKSRPAPAEQGQPRVGTKPIPKSPR